MNCPICSVTLVITDKQGIEIDYCPKCRGIWLDRGELDKIIERTSGSHENHFYEPQHSYSNDYHKHQKHHRQKNWLSELFD
jgi:Zn-finger nucleic acid-binding protein